MRKVRTLRIQLSSAYVTCIRWNKQLADLATMDTEAMQFRTRDDVPDKHAEVYPAGHQHARLVSTAFVVRVK